MNGEVTLFGETTFRNQNQKFGIKVDDRRRHMYVIGKSGMGKSTLLENMIAQDINKGRGLAVVDPHGDLAEKIIRYIPDRRVEEVVYFNPADAEYPIAFNVVEQVEPHLRHLVASGLIGVFQKLWADSWGPRLEYILRNAILAVLDIRILLYWPLLGCYQIRIFVRGWWKKSKTQWLRPFGLMSLAAIMINLLLRQ